MAGGFGSRSGTPGLAPTVWGCGWRRVLREGSCSRRDLTRWIASVLSAVFAADVLQIAYKGLEDIL